MEPESQISHTKELKSSGKWILVISITGFVLSIILTIMQFISYQNTQSLSNQVRSLKVEITKLQGINDTVNMNRYNAFVSFVEHEMEGAVVTDQLVLNKISFMNKVIVVDVDTQPSTALKYQGRDKFNMQDREVKSMVVDLLDKSKDAYAALQKSYNGAIPTDKWDDNPIVVTVKNYELGTFKNGKFYLKGETN